MAWLPLLALEPGVAPAAAAGEGAAGKPLPLSSQLLLPAASALQCCLMRSSSAPEGSGAAGGGTAGRTPARIAVRAAFLGGGIAASYTVSIWSVR